MVFEGRVCGGYEALYRPHRLSCASLQAKHQHADSDGAARLAPLPPDESARLAESFGSEGLENFGHVESRLRQHQEQADWLEKAHFKRGFKSLKRL